jgi:hypothetical protein
MYFFLLVNPESKEIKLLAEFPLDPSVEIIIEWN